MIAARLLMPFSILIAAPAAAERLRDLCPDRPGLNTPPCTVDPGHVLIEVGLADWTLDRQRDVRTDTILGGDVDVRVGLGDRTEVRIGWTPYGHVRTRDRTSGAVDRRARVGDVTLGLKRNLANPDGSGVSLALLPYATLPVGRAPVGAGDWGGGLVVPVSYEVGERIKLELTPEVDAAVDEDGGGRHLAYGSAIGISDDLTDTLNLTAELQALHDRDPAGHRTQELLGLSLAWQPRDGLQFDAGTALGLDHAAPDVELYVGLSRRF